MIAHVLRGSRGVIGGALRVAAADAPDASATVGNATQTIATAITMAIPNANSFAVPTTRSYGVLSCAHQADIAAWSIDHPDWASRKTIGSATIHHLPSLVIVHDSTTRTIDRSNDARASKFSHGSVDRNREPRRCEIPDSTSVHDPTERRAALAPEHAGEGIHESGIVA